jgi:hypothetical protein
MKMMKARIDLKEVLKLLPQESLTKARDRNKNSLLPYLLAKPK